MVVNEMGFFGQVVYFIFTILAAYLVRSWLIRESRGWFARGFAGDSSVHIQIIDSLRKKRWPPNIPKYVIPNRMSYPILFHKFCTCFSNANLQRRGYIPNLILFILFTGTLFAYVSYIGFTYLQGFPPWGGFATAVLSAVSVQNLTNAGPSIAYIKLSSRLLGRFSVSFAMAGLFGYLAFADFPSAVISVASVAVALMSSTFGAQALLFIFPLIAIFSGSAQPVWIGLIGFIFAVLISRGYVWTSAKSMVRYWWIYQRYIQNSRYHRSSLSSFISLSEVVSHVRAKKIRQAIVLAIRGEPTRSLVYYPELFLIGVLAIFQNDVVVYASSAPLFLGVLIVYLITATSYFNFLGEAYRYIEYGFGVIGPLLLFWSLYSGLKPEFAWGVAALYLLTVLFISSVLQKLFGHKPPHVDDALGKFLAEAKVDENDIVFPVSMRLGADIVARANCKSFWWQPGGIVDRDLYEKYLHEYPYLSTDWKPLAELHGVTKVIVDDNALAAFNDVYDFSRLQVIAKCYGYTAYNYPEFPNSS